MGIFKSSYEKEMDASIAHLEMNMSNNYKDAAQADFKTFKDMFESFSSSGKIKGKTLEKYSKILAQYEDKMKGYTHKDQKPYWT